MKKFVSGILTGAILTSSLAFAASYVAEDVGFKIFVNGKEFTSAPAVAINGSTYLPLRAVGDVLGIPVNWNSELNQVEVGNSAPVAENNEYSRTNPAPINTVQTYTSKNPNPFFDLSNIIPDHSVSVRVMEVIRGEKANAQVKKDNMFNSEPKEGYEYIIAKVAISALNVQNDASVNASYTDFTFYSGNNEEYDDAYVVVNDQISQNLYTGGNAEGYIVGQVKKDDANPKVAYGLLYGSEAYGKAIWFKLQ